MSDTMVLSVSRFLQNPEKRTSKSTWLLIVVQTYYISQCKYMLLYRNHEKYNGFVSYLCFLMRKDSTSFTAFSESNTVCLI